MTAPQELSIAEIRNYMLANGYKVTNHNLVKHFKKFLTGESQNEARKQFKTYVNILATIKNENNQKYLILRKKYINECPSLEETLNTTIPSSPGATSMGLENSSSSINISSPRQPPPYKPPPEVTNKPVSATSTTTPLAPLVTGITVHQENVETYKECVQEFAAALQGLKHERSTVPEEKTTAEQPELRPKKTSRVNSIDEANNNLNTNNKENIPRFSFSSGTSTTSTTSEDGINNNGNGENLNPSDAENENPISVKEATRKFNRMASEEEAKVLSPPPKKKPDTIAEPKTEPPVSYSHPKAKEWVVAMAKANYQELAKLANDHPELVKLQDPSTGYTALHWAAKHGNEDVIKLIAGTYKADVNARSNGGYTPLHLAVQFGRNDILELLCNVYKANRNIMDWSGNKPLDYSKQRTSVSDSTYSKIKAKRGKHAVDRDLSFLRIGSLRKGHVVKRTTEAFSNLLGVGGNGSATMPIAGQHSRRNHHVHASKTISTPLGVSNSSNKIGVRSSVPVGSKYENVHKSWGSADSIPQGGGGGGAITANTDDTNIMPPPKTSDSLVKKRQKAAKRGSVTSCATDSPRNSISSSNSSSNLNSGYSSMPTTPNQLRSHMGSTGSGGGGVGGHAAAGDSDSDSACGFGSHWSVGGGQ